MTALALLLALAAAGAATDPGQSLKPAKAALASAGPLAFGPDGILFVGDTAGATLWALDTGDRRPATARSTSPASRTRSRRCSARRRTRSRSTT